MKKKSFCKIIDEELQLSFWASWSLNPSQKYLLKKYVEKLKEIIKEWEKIKLYLKYFEFVEEKEINLYDDYLNPWLKLNPPDIVKVIWIPYPFLGGTLDELGGYSTLLSLFKTLKEEKYKNIELAKWWPW